MDRPGKKMLADGETTPVFTLAGQQVTLADGTTLAHHGDASAWSLTRWVAQRGYRLRRVTGGAGQELAVLRWQEAPGRGRLAAAEARLYVDEVSPELLVVVCYALSQLQRPRGWREAPAGFTSPARAAPPYTPAWVRDRPESTTPADGRNLTGVVDPVARFARPGRLTGPPRRRDHHHAVLGAGLVDGR